MDQITKFAGELIADQSGVTAIEYGLIAALISLAIVVLIGAIGGSISDIWTYWTTAVTSVAP